MASKPFHEDYYSSPTGSKRKFDDTELPTRYPSRKRRQSCEKDWSHTPADNDNVFAPGSSSPLSEVSEDALPSAETIRRWEQERLAYEKLHKDLKATLTQIRDANKGRLTHEALKYLQSEVMAHDPQTQVVHAATNTEIATLLTSSETQTEVAEGTSTETQTLPPASIEATTQTMEPMLSDTGIQTMEPMLSDAGIQTMEPMLSDASIQTMEPILSHASTQTDPIPKKVPTSEEIYKTDLKSIRRARSFVSSTNVTTVRCRLRKEPTTTPSATRFGTNSYLPTPSSTGAPLSSSSQVVSLLDDDDDDDTLISSNWRTGGSSLTGHGFEALIHADESDGGEEFGQNVEFYGIQRTRIGSTHSSDLLRYQDRQTGIGEYPSPTAGLRLRQHEYLHHLKSKHRKNPFYQATCILEKSSWGDPAPVDDQAAIMSKWTRNGSYQVYKGFPLVEDVEFIVQRNAPPKEPDGDCYWRSVAFCLYGSDEHWDVVKAEHLGYMHYVLSKPRHPRHKMYSEHLNGRFFDTSTVDNRGAFKANIWQLLHLAHAWTPAVVSQITADLYNICVVIFTLDGATATETNVRGVYNSRHIFLCFTNGNHFQPMTPNQYDAWEFRYPRITVGATAKYVNAPKATSAKQTWDHPWRKEFSSTVLPPVPRLHGCDVEELRSYLGSKRKT